MVWSQLPGLAAVPQQQLPGDPGVLCGSLMPHLAQQMRPAAPHCSCSR